MKLTRPIAFFDIESTGTDTQKDKIVTLAILKLNPDGSQDPKMMEFNPGVLMSDEVVAIHGITNEKAATWPVFSAPHGKEIVEFLSGCDLAGYNLINFDIPMLWEELWRVGIDWDVSKCAIIDAGNIFKKREERSLSAAVKFYCAHEHDAAHNAMCDVVATMNVLNGQLERYTDMKEMDVAALSKFSKMDDRMDLAGIIARNKDGDAVFNTKRNRGVRVIDDTGYAAWILRSDFPAQTKRVLNDILESDHSQGYQNRLL